MQGGATGSGMSFALGVQGKCLRLDLHGYSCRGWTTENQQELHTVTQRRDKPYLWPSLIKKLLAGEAHCEWAAWFCAHHTQYDRRPSDFDFAQWNAEHAELVRTRASALRASGFTVSVEGQNQFRLPGHSGAVLRGTPDIVAIKESDALVIDCKTGRPRDSDYFQVLIYMLALPHARPQWQGKRLAGEVQYRDRSVTISPEELTPDMQTRIWQLLKRVSGVAALPRVPSYAECSYCDLTATDCSERVEQPPISQQDEFLPF
jgi:PD-(D/E)XK nuclease superfamily